MEDKYLIFLISTAVLVPLGISIASKSERALNLVFMALVFGTTQPDSLFWLPTDINFLSREWYRGSTRGIEISYLDLLAITLLIASKAWRRREGMPTYTPPSYGYLKAYFIWAAFTVFFISEPMIFGVFEITKILRGIIIFLAVSAFVRGDKQLRIFIYTIIAIAFFEGGIALYHRYIVGIHRIYGTLPHPNSLSMFCLQILPITLSLWFAEDLSRKLRRAALAASALIAVTIILTISRTGFAAMAVLVFMTIVINARGRWNARNLGFMFLVLVVGAGITFKAWDSLSARYESFDLKNEYVSEKGDRGSYFRKGWPAFEDNPIAGVGLNNWSYWISNKYSAKAGYHSEIYPSTNRAPLTGNQEAPAHNLYLITIVELGLVGLALLSALFMRWIYISAKGIFKSTSNYKDQLRRGLFLSLLGVLMQSVTEWEVRQTSLYFMMHVVAGVSAYLYYQYQKIKN